jgi:hypothetical protein
MINPRLHETGTKSNRDRFGHSIIYNRCLHETGTKITQTDLKSFRLHDGPSRLTSDRHEFRPG